MTNRLSSEEIRAFRDRFVHLLDTYTASWVLIENRQQAAEALANELVEFIITAASREGSS